MKKKLLIIPLLLLVVCGCEDRKCVESHQEQDTCFYYIYNKVGSVTMMTPVYYPCTRTVCDRYEEENK